MVEAPCGSMARQIPPGPERSPRRRSRSVQHGPASRARRAAFALGLPHTGPAAARPGIARVQGHPGFAAARPVLTPALRAGLPNSARVRSISSGRPPPVGTRVRARARHLRPVPPGSQQACQARGRAFGLAPPAVGAAVPARQASRNWWPPARRHTAQPPAAPQAARRNPTPCGCSASATGAAHRHRDLRSTRARRQHAVPRVGTDGAEPPAAGATVRPRACVVSGGCAGKARAVVDAVGFGWSFEHAHETLGAKLRAPSGQSPRGMARAPCRARN